MKDVECLFDIVIHHLVFRWLRLESFVRNPLAEDVFSFRLDGFSQRLGHLVDCFFVRFHHIRQFAWTELVAAYHLRIAHIALEGKQFPLGYQVDSEAVVRLVEAAFYQKVHVGCSLYK